MNILSYPRSIASTLFSVLWTFIFCFVILFLAGLRFPRKVVDFAIFVLWSQTLLKVNGVKVDLRGAENAHGTKKGFLICFNHSSHMDIPVLYAYFPRSFRYGAKIELFKIPFFGRAMKMVGVLPIDRRNRNQVMKVYDSAIARVNNGEVFALAPEGTRQKEPNIGVFKRGPFEFAINAQMDIVPVVMVGTFDVLRPGALLVNWGQWSRTVVMQVLPRVSTQGLPIEQAQALQEQVRAAMVTAHETIKANRLEA